MTIDRKAYIIFLCLISLLAIVINSCSTTNPQKIFENEIINSRPNIIVFMADDIGLGDIGFYHRERTGSEPIVPTPNLDDLIRTGMRFSDAHSPASLCAPTRFSMLTGNFPERGPLFGVWRTDQDARIDPEFTTSARLAKAGGYQTAFFGKWGLGGVWSGADHGYENLDLGALSYGFDYALELPEGIQNAPLAFYKNREWEKLTPNSEMTELTREQARFNKKTGRIIASPLMGDSAWEPSQVGEILIQDSVDFVRQNADAKTNRPVFIYFNSQAVHIPHTPPEQFLGAPISGTTPGAHGDMISELDAQVGALISVLKETGEYENTLFIFTSDNGGLNWDKALKDTGHDSSNGLRARKGSIYEGGHRVPFIAVWPGKIEAGSVSDYPIVSHDVVATIAALAGQNPEEGRILDSLNLLPILTDQAQAQDRLFMTHASKAGPFFAIRQDKWKLIMKYDKDNNPASLTPVALFDLDDNVQEDESGNLIGDPRYQSLIRDLEQQYKSHRLRKSPTIISKD